MPGVESTKITYLEIPRNSEAHGSLGLNEEFDYVIVLGVDKKWKQSSYCTSFSRARLGLTVIQKSE